MVDDVEYSYEQLSQINVNEIESISILKDASTTAIYGIKGANGVLVVKTRRGEEGKTCDPCACRSRRSDTCP